MATKDSKASETQEPQVDLEAAKAVNDKLGEASGIVLRKVMWSAGVGLVPVPLADIGALFGLQLYMTKQLADLFGVPFSNNRAKTIISSLVGAVVPIWLAFPVASGLKMIPVIGFTTATVAMSITGGAATYALGKLFTYHFASGGTLLDFDTEKMKAKFAEKFEEGKEVVSDIKAGA